MVVNNEVTEKYLESIVQRERQERLATIAEASNVLSKLNISIDNLPQNCQQLLQDVCAAQAASQMEELDPVAIALRQSIELTDKLDDEYEILKLRQKNKELQGKLDRNTKLIEQLGSDLEQSRHSLASRTPCPETVQDYCRQLRQKVTSYEENYKKAKSRFSAVAVPEQAMPKSLRALATSLAQLTEEAASLRQRAEDITHFNDTRIRLLNPKK